VRGAAHFIERWIPVIAVAELDHRISDLELRVHDAVSFLRGNAEFLFRPEDLFHEVGLRWMRVQPRSTQ
jgi:hypothetical protein